MLSKQCSKYLQICEILLHFCTKFDLRAEVREKILKTSSQFSKILWSLSFKMSSKTLTEF